MEVRNMLYFDDKSLVFSTGLSLKDTCRIISDSESEDDVRRLLKEKGEKYLKRYDTIIKYQNLTLSGKLKEPILPIFAALPCVGKTTFAREIATRLGIGNVMGGDAIRASYRELISREEKPEFFTSIYGAWQFVGDKKETRENIILGFYKQSEIMNSLMQRIVADRGIRDGESVVIEYLHFLPSQYDPEILRHNSIIPIVLRLDSEEEHRRRISRRNLVTHLKGKSERFYEILDMYRMMQDVQTEDARKTGVPVVPTDDFDKALDMILDIIFERIELLNKGESVSHENIGIMKKIHEERSANPVDERKY